MRLSSPDSILHPIDTVNALPAVLFVLLFGSVLAWFVMCSKLFTRLKTNHPQVYDSLGRPSLVANNSPRNNLAFLGFLLGGHFATLNDVPLNKLCRFMRVFFFCFLALFVLLIVVVASQHKGHPG